MKIGRKIYNALIAEFGNEVTPPEIARVVGLNGTTICKLKKGQGIGTTAAEWLVKQDDKYLPLLAEAEKARTESIQTRLKTRAQTVGTPTKFKLDELPKHLQAFCGYIS